MDQEKTQDESVKTQSLSLVFTLIVMNFVKNIFFNFLQSCWAFCKRQLFGEKKPGS